MKLESMTEQDIFDKVTEHLLTQNQRASNGVLCQYRTENGLKCAVGCLIPDEQYSYELEYRPIWFLGDKISPIFHKYHDLLTLLQQIHDRINVEGWKNALKSLANERQLEWKFEER